MAVAHGGSWDVSTRPYDSNASLIAAYAADDDGVKIDVRITSDNVPVISHSSPLEIYESLDCANRKIEEMTAAEVTGLPPVPVDVRDLPAARRRPRLRARQDDRQLCVKRAVDYARTIAEVHALGAEDFAFIEINASELGTLIPTLRLDRGPMLAAREPRRDDVALPVQLAIHVGLQHGRVKRER